MSSFCVSVKTAVVSRARSLTSMLRHRNIPFQVAFFYSEGALSDLLSWQKTINADLVFCHLIRMGEYARQLPVAIKVLDYMDAFSKGMERLQSGGAWWLRIPAGIERKRLLAYEASIFSSFNYHIIISKQDREHIPHRERNRIDVIPNGVDFGYFQPAPAEKKYDLLFNGHMSYPPNITSAMYAATEIFPLVKKQKADSTLLIAGADPVKKIRQLQGEGVIIKGWVNDIRTVYSSSRILVAPMLISIGLQNKILQAMAMKIPCVISAMANNALGAEHGKHVFVAETPDEYCRYILLLMRDPDIYSDMAEAALQYVKSHFTWEKNAGIVTEKILSMIQIRD